MPRAPDVIEKPTMNTGSAVVTGRPRRSARKSRWPARLDWMQSVSGLVLALFMWGHMFFVSSILFGKDAMWTVTRFFEGYFVFGRSYPWIVSMAVAGVLALLVVHAMLALRKFPIDYGQYRAFRDHVGTMKHADTTLWWWQVVTGFAMFFLVLGLATLAAYMKIGIEHAAHAGEVYTPAWAAPVPAAPR